MAVANGRTSASSVIVRSLGPAVTLTTCTRGPAAMADSRAARACSRPVPCARQNMKPATVGIATTTIPARWNRLNAFRLRMSVVPVCPPCRFGFKPFIEYIEAWRLAAQERVADGHQEQRRQGRHHQAPDDGPAQRRVLLAGPSSGA